MKRLLKLFPLLVVCFSLTGCNGFSSYDKERTIAFISIALIIALFVILALYSNMIRDEISNCEEFHENAQKLQKKAQVGIRG